MNKADASRMRALLSEYVIASPRDEDKQKTIELVTAALEHRKNVRTPLSSLFATQLMHISKPLWATQIGALILAVLLSDAFSAIHEMQVLLFTAVSILSFYAVPELMRARIYGMSEVEAVCKNSPAKILIIKLILIGIVNIGVILTLTLFLSRKFEVRFIELLVYGLVPFNIMNFINLLLLNIFKMKSPFAFLSASLVTALFLNIGKFYLDIAQNVWNGLFILSFILLVFELYRLIMAMREGRSSWYGIEH